MMNVPAVRDSTELKIESSSFISTEMERGRSYSIDAVGGINFLSTHHHYKDWNASSMGVNQSGKLAVLAARRGFLVVDFDDLPNPRKVTYPFKWEPGPLQWNPHASKEEYFASVVNTTVKIWNINELSLEVQHNNPAAKLAGHTRAISDIDWNNFDPCSLLTCSMDTYINMWDTRVVRKPASTFTTVAGSSQVKWNRKNRYLFASAHDGDVRIWDSRKGNIPTIYIAGHLSKIHSLDWSPQKEAYFVTASNDLMVKFWSFTSPKQPKASFSNQAPVWKARYTPFGNGLVTVLVSQLRRSENSLFLWNINEFKSPVEKFEGHSDVITDFQWRKLSHSDENHYQLVSWGKDQHLRLWTIEKKAMQAITGIEYNKSFSRVSSTLPSPLSPTVPSFVPPVDTTPGLMLTKVNRVMDALPPTTSNTTAVKETRVSSEPFKNTVNGKMGPERPKNLKLTDKPLALLDTKPPYSPTSVVPPTKTIIPSGPTREGALSPLSGHTTAFRKHTSTNHLTGPEATFGESPQLQTLKQEFALITHSDSIYKIEKLDAEQRICTVWGRAGPILLKLQITFPLEYPDNVGPEFELHMPSSMKQSEAKTELKKILQDIAHQHVKHNRPCLEPCLRQFRNHIEQMRTIDAHRSDDSLTPITPPANQFRPFTFKPVEPAAENSYNDSTVPFPRACGARFCSAGDRLVIFTRSERFGGVQIPEKNLRSLSALYAYMNNRSTESSLDTSAAFEENEISYKKPKSVVGLVYITNTSSLLPVSKYLAQNYQLNGDDPSKLCLKNAEVAASIPSMERKDLVQAWSLLSLVMAKKLTPNPHLERTFVHPWPLHPFGRELVNSLFQYYESIKDVQMLALMSCMLSKQSLPDEIKNTHVKTPPEAIADEQRKVRAPNTESPEFLYHYSVLSSGGEDNWSPPTFVEEKQNIDPLEEDRKQHNFDCHLLNPNESNKYDQFKSYYGEILYRWNFITQFAEVEKYIGRKTEQIEQVDLGLNCTKCSNVSKDPYCGNGCNQIILKCCVCRIGVRGLVSFCHMCGHGGHLFHLNKWFENNDMCPSGCGHYCRGVLVQGE